MSQELLAWSYGISNDERDEAYKHHIFPPSISIEGFYGVE